MWVGRQFESRLLRQAIMDRRSLLLYGKSGAGKTSLLDEVLNSLPGELRKSCILCEAHPTPHATLQELALRFAQAGDQWLLSRALKDQVTHEQLDRWLGAQTSLRLRGVLRHAARATIYSVFLDASVKLPDGLYRLIQEWIWSGRTPVVILARGPSERELGRAGRLFWHGAMRAEIGPLDPAAACELFALSVAKTRLTPLPAEEFRDFVMKESELLPGRIIALCEMASDPAYLHEGRIKLHPLRVDFQMKLNGNVRGTHSIRASNHG
jgi:Cdc6-like AAA superfamily ATPase